MIPHGFVLTHAYDLAQFRRQLSWAGATLAIAVEGWGLPWTADQDALIRAVLAPSFPVQIDIRSTDGDPSYNLGERAGFDPAATVERLSRWLRVPTARKKRVILGNEQNVRPKQGPPVDPWVYRYQLDRTITKLRESFPDVEIVSPALSLSGNGTRGEEAWMYVLSVADESVPVPIFQRVDYLGVHVYGEAALGKTPAGKWADALLQEKQALDLALAFAPNLPWMVTEYGINRPTMSQPEKGAAYAAWVRQLPTLFPPLMVRGKAVPRVQGAAAYHLCADEAVDPHYHATRLLLESYGGVRQG